MSSEIPAVDVPRRVWVQQFYRDVDTTTSTVPDVAMTAPIY